MHLDDAITRTLGVLRTRIPAALDAEEAKSYAQVAALSSFVASTSQHSLSIAGTVYGPVAGASQQAVLAALHALAVAGAPSTYAGYVVDTGTAARLYVPLPGATLTAGTNTTVSTQTRGALHGTLDDPAAYIRGTDDLPELEYPQLLIQSEGDVDIERYVSDHKRRHYPLAVKIVGFERDTEELADLAAWSYASAVEAVLEQQLAQAGVVGFVEVTAAGPPQPWGDNAHGREITVRATAHQYAVPFGT